MIDSSNSLIVAAMGLRRLIVIVAAILLILVSGYYIILMSAYQVIRNDYFGLLSVSGIAMILWNFAKLIL